MLGVVGPEDRWSACGCDYEPSRHFPVNYRVSDGKIVIRTAEGQKLAAAVLGTSVAFEVDALDDTSRSGWSIVVKGTAEEPQRLEDYLSAEDLGIEPWAQGDKSRFIQIVPHQSPVARSH